MKHYTVLSNRKQKTYPAGVEPTPSGTRSMCFSAVSHCPIHWAALLHHAQAFRCGYIMLTADLVGSNTERNIILVEVVGRSYYALTVISNYNADGLAYSGTQTRLIKFLGACVSHYAFCSGNVAMRIPKRGQPLNKFKVIEAFWCRDHFIRWCLSHDDLKEPFDKV